MAENAEVARGVTAQHVSACIVPGLDSGSKTHFVIKLGRKTAPRVSFFGWKAFQTCVKPNLFSSLAGKLVQESHSLDGKHSGPV